MGDAIRRGVVSWQELSREQRRAGVIALALFATMFLPWYEKTGFVKNTTISQRLSAWGAFSFVEAGVLLVAAGVLVLLFNRGEKKAFHLPGGDGAVITAAGGWVALLIFYRQFDKPGASIANGTGVTVGVSWGIFVAFIGGLALAYAGLRLRAAHLPEPPMPGDVAPSDEPRRPRRTEAVPPPATAAALAEVDDTAETAVAPRRRAPARPVDQDAFDFGGAGGSDSGGEQLTFDEAE